MSTEEAQIPLTDTPLQIAGRTLRSRLVLGTGGFPRLETLADAIRATRAELVTVALRRIDPAAAGRSSTSSRSAASTCCPTRRAASPHATR